MVRFRPEIAANLIGETAPGVGGRSAGDELLSGRISGSSQTPEVRSIAFADSSLQSCVWSAYHPKTLITNVTTLDCSSEGITDLDGLEQLTSLIDLNLSNNPISTMGEVSALTVLTVLNVSWTQISDLAPVSGLTSLDKIYLRDTPVASLLPLIGLSQLTELHAAETLVDAVPNIVSSSLRVLDLTDTPLVDIAAVQDFPDLENLYLSHDPLNVNVVWLPGRGPFGDISAIIALASAPGSSLAVVDLSPHPGLFCDQLNELRGHMPSGLDVPVNCSPLPVPLNLGTTLNPSETSNFWLYWNGVFNTDPNLVFEFEIEEVRLDSGSSRQLITTNSFMNLGSQGAIPPGLLSYRVRTCLGQTCGAWSQPMYQSIVGSATQLASEALDLVTDPALSLCLSDQIADFSVTQAGQIFAVDCVDEGVTSLQGVAAFPHLTTLHLSRNAIANLTPLTPLLNRGAFAALPVVFDLRLAENNLTSPQLDALLIPNVEFSVLDLSDNELSGSALGAATFVGDLDISDNLITSLQALDTVLVDRLFARNNSLTQIDELLVTDTLQLDNNSISTFLDPTPFASTLKVLSLSNNPLPGFVDFGAAMSATTNLEILKVVNSGRNSFSFLNDLPLLREFDGSDNLASVIFASPANANLTRLVARDNLLGAIASFEHLSSLEVLDLRSNFMQFFPE
ncbi:MAG: leucine-rich repeat domain-containing protein, partial [Pseudomonadota bacterium]